MRSRAGRTAPAHPHEKLAFIEGMRGVAALYVVLGHFCNMVDPGALWSKSNAPDWLQALMAPFQNGHLAVAAFIVISGFCLQLSLFGSKDGKIQDLKRFFKRRAWRILPPYYAALVFSLIVALTVTSQQAKPPFTQYVPVTWTNLTAHAFMVHNLSADWMYKINGVLWSIAIEAQLYILFPLLVASLFRVGRFWLIALTSGLALALMGAVPETLKLYPWYLPLFVVGMAAAHFAYRPNVRAGTAPGLATTLAVLAVVMGSLWARKAAMPVSDAFIGFATAAALYVGSVAPHAKIVQAFGWKPLVLLGGFSYSLYLMHHPIQQVLFVYRPGFIVGPVASLVYLLVFGLPLVLLLTYLFSQAFERPFMARKTSRQMDAEDGLTPTSLPLRAYASAGPARARYASTVRPAVIPTAAPSASTLL
jgi:peptidoglycan/LPS O-acetylase OafA/YrhL